MRRDGHRDRQTDRQTDRHTHKQTAVAKRHTHVTHVSVSNRLPSYKAQSVKFTLDLWQIYIQTIYITITTCDIWTQYVLAHLSSSIHLSFTFIGLPWLASLPLSFCFAAWVRSKKRWLYGNVPATCSWRNHIQDFVLNANTHTAYLLC